MAGSKSSFFEANLLNFVFGGGAIWTATASIYHALSTAAFTTAATGASMTEVSTTSTAYTRVGLTRNTTNFPAATGSNPASISNATAVTWSAATASWGTVLACYIVDSVTVGAGNVLYGYDLTVSKTVSTGDTASIAAAAGETFTEQ